MPGKSGCKWGWASQTPASPMSQLPPATAAPHECFRPVVFNSAPNRLPLLIFCLPPPPLHRFQFRRSARSVPRLLLGCAAVHRVGVVRQRGAGRAAKRPGAQERARRARAWPRRIGRGGRRGWGGQLQPVAPPLHCALRPAEQTLVLGPLHHPPPRPSTRTIPDNHDNPRPRPASFTPTVTPPPLSSAAQPQRCRVSLPTHAPRPTNQPNQVPGLEDGTMARQIRGGLHAPQHLRRGGVPHLRVCIVLDARRVSQGKAASDLQH